MTNERKRLVSAFSGLALAATVGLVGLVPSSPAQAEPDIQDVQNRVQRLYHEAEQASERLNDAKIELAALRRDLRSLEADQQRQLDRLTVVREELAGAVVDQYQSRTMSAVGQLVLSEDPAQFMSELSTMAAYNDIQAELFSSYATEVKALRLREQVTKAREAELAETNAQLFEEKERIDDKVAEAKALLAELKAEERERLEQLQAQRERVERRQTQEVSRSSSAAAPATSSAPASGRAGAAVSYAMAQVGDAYVYGAAGPSGFDCSGLTMMAWAQAGVSLPHSSTAQFSSGPSVSESELQPGDLVFYYSPISHVGMYIGNGMIVHAANPSTGVNLAPLHSMPYVGAVRPG